MSPFVARITHRHDEQWVWPITLMCLVLGFMISMAWVTERNRESRYQALDPNQRTRVSETAIDIEAFQQMQNEVTSLRNENTKLQNGLAKGNESSKLLNEELQQTKLFAGLTAIEGPGVTVTLRDSSVGPMKIGNENVFVPDTNIHDTDVLRVVNELYSAGAEALSINDHRIAGPSSIRCVGPTILINDVKVASPIEIKAIGDPKTLVGALNLNGGILSDFRSVDPNMVSLEEEHSMRLEPFSGHTAFRFAKNKDTTASQGAS